MSIDDVNRCILRYDYAKSMAQVCEAPSIVNYEISIRPMQVGDLQGVMCVERSAYVAPWRLEDFYRELTLNQLAHYFVAEQNREIVAFVGIWLMVDEAHITNIAVVREQRGKKIGEQLLLFILDEAKRLGAVRTILEVRVSNSRAQNLYLKHRFRYVGLRRNYYHDNGEDAFLMERDLKC
jgi:ribosomal-protein-alanine N-acetyltransferase